MATAQRENRIEGISTDQLCPVAAAVDALGDIRALLILRDLVWHGPMSAADLHERNRSLPPETIEQVLRRLVDAEMVEPVRVTGQPVEHRLTPSAAASVETVVAALARFGSPLLARRPITSAMLAQAVTDAAEHHHDEVVQLDLTALVRLEIAGRTIGVVLAPGLLRPDAGVDPDATLACTQDTFLELLDGTISLNRARVNGEITIEGPAEPVEVLMSLLRRTPHR